MIDYTIDIRKQLYPNLEVPEVQINLISDNYMFINNKHNLELQIVGIESSSCRCTTRTRYFTK